VTGSGFFYGYFVVAASFVILTMWSGMFQTFGIFLKPLAAEFGWTRAMTSGAFTLLALLGGFLAIIGGRMTDRYGPRVVLTICGVFFGVGYFLMSQINDLWQLYLFYGVIVALGMAGTGHAPNMPTVARWFIRRRSLMSGVVTSGMGIGVVVVVPLASWLLATVDWRYTYMIMAGIALVLIVTAAQFSRKEPAQMGLLPYGADEVVADTPHSSAQGYSLRQALGSGQFWIICAILFFSMFAMMVVSVHIIPHATDIGISPVAAANILVIRGAVGIPSNILMGLVADRIGKKPVMIFTFILRTTALFWLLAADELWAFYLIAVLLGLSTAGVGVLIYPMIAEIFGLRSMGVIVASAQYAGIIGSSVSPLMAAVIFDVTGTYDIGFVICGVFSVIGLILALLLRSTRADGAAVVD